MRGGYYSGMAATRPLLFLMLSMLSGFRMWGADPTNSATLGAMTPEQANAVAIVQARQRALDAEKKGDVPAQVQALNDEADARLRAHEFDAGEKLRLQVLHLQEARAGRNSLAVSDALLNLGWFYGNMARYEDAQEALDRCQEIRQRLLGPDAAPVAEVLNALGALEENRSNLTLAEAFYQQAIAIQERALGTRSAVTANTWNNLATLYWIMGDYAPAQKLFTQALAVRERTLGPNSAVVAKTLNNLALLDISLGDYEGAGDYFQRALRIRTARFGPDHPSTLTTLSQLGLLYVREGDDVRAEPLLVRAVEMQEKISRAGDPDVARSLAQLAMLYDRRKLYDKAEPLHLRALEIRRGILGDEHPEVAASLAALARHDHAQGKLAEALPLYEQALKIDGEALGENHPDTLAIAGDLACLDIESRRPDDAARLARDVAGAQENMLNGVFAFAPEHQRMDFERTLSTWDLPAALADADLLAETVLRTKGVVLDSLLEDEAVTRAGRDPGCARDDGKAAAAFGAVGAERGGCFGRRFFGRPDGPRRPAQARRGGAGTRSGPRRQGRRRRQDAPRSRHRRVGRPGRVAGWRGAGGICRLQPLHRASRLRAGLRRGGADPRRALPVGAARLRGGDRRPGAPGSKIYAETGARCRPGGGAARALPVAL